MIYLQIFKQGALSVGYYNDRQLRQKKSVLQSDSEDQGCKSEAWQIGPGRSGPQI